MTNQQKHIEHLIELYFDGLTSTAQEKELRELAADPDIKGESMDEFRAVISYAASSPASPSGETVSVTPRVMPRIVTWLSAAAVIALISVAVWRLSASDNAGMDNECIAYIDGKAVDDPTEVMRIVDSELDALGDAATDLSDDVSAELNAISSAMNQDNTPI